MTKGEAQAQATATGQRSLKFRPLSPVVGAEVTGMDFSREADQDTVRQLRDAFDRYNALLFRNVTLAVEEQARFGRIFGQIKVRGDYKPNEFPDTQHISNTRADGMLGDGELTFHYDQLFYPDPLKAIMLYGVEVPKGKGGETLFCNTSLAYDALPDDFKVELHGLSCIHAYNYKGNRADPNFARSGGADAPRFQHSLVWIHPRTGRRSLWFSKASTDRVVELDTAASELLLARLREAVYRPEFIHTHRWHVGDLLIWSNQVVQHARTPFDPAEPRTLRRTPIVEG